MCNLQLLWHHATEKYAFSMYLRSASLDTSVSTWWLLIWLISACDTAFRRCLNWSRSEVELNLATWRVFVCEALKWVQRTRAASNWFSAARKSLVSLKNRWLLITKQKVQETLTENKSAKRRLARRAICENANSLNLQIFLCWSIDIWAFRLFESSKSLRFVSAQVSALNN